MNRQKNKTCEICNKTFKKHTTLIAHQNKTKPCTTDAKEFICKYCNSQYGSISGLKYHVKHCDKNDDDDKIKIKQLEKQIVKLQNDKINYLESELDYFKKMANKNNITNNTVGNRYYKT